MRLSNLLLNDLKRRKNFQDIGDFKTSKLLEELSFITRPRKGGLNKKDPLIRIENNLSQKFLSNLERKGFQKVDLPVLQENYIWEQSGRWNQFNQDIYETQQGEILLPTTEEPNAELLKHDKNLSYKELPILTSGVRKLFRKTNSNQFRRLPEFHLLDSYSIHENEQELSSFVAGEIEPFFYEFFEDLGLDVLPVEKRKGYTDFKYLTPEGDDDAFVDNEGNGFHEFEDASEDAEEVNCLSLGVKMELGDDYTEDLGVTYVDDNNESKNPVMGNYGIGLERLVYAVLDSSREDSDGRFKVEWPEGIEPYSLGIIGVPGSDFGDEVYEDVLNANPEVLHDDTDDSIGTKVARMYAIGVPEITVVGDEEQENGVLSIEDISTGSQKQVKIKDLQPYS